MQPSARTPGEDQCASFGVAGVYNCPLNGICVAPPRFSGNVTSNGIVFDSASDYLVPLVFEPR